MSRPHENRVKLTCYVLPETHLKLRALAVTAFGTLGRAVDEAFGVRASKKVAGAGRKAPRGQHGRAKRSSSRAKRANDEALRRGETKL